MVHTNQVYTPNLAAALPRLQEHYGRPVWPSRPTVPGTKVDFGIHSLTHSY